METTMHQQDNLKWSFEDGKNTARDMIECDWKALDSP